MDDDFTLVASLTGFASFGDARMGWLFNNQRLLKLVGNISPAEAETNLHAV